MAKLKEFTSNASKSVAGYSFYCPGCKFVHMVYTEEPHENGCKWKFNGDKEKPTFKPSIVVTYPWGEARLNKVCHTFVTDGKIEFLADCTHELAGQTVEIPEFRWDEEEDILGEQA